MFNFGSGFSGGGFNPERMLRQFTGGFGGHGFGGYNRGYGGYHRGYGGHGIGLPVPGFGDLRIDIDPRGGVGVGFGGPRGYGRGYGYDRGYGGYDPRDRYSLQGYRARQQGYAVPPRSYYAPEAEDEGVEQPQGRPREQAEGESTGNTPQAQRSEAETLTSIEAQIKTLKPEQVLAIQLGLEQNGYSAKQSAAYSAVDGKPGPKTARAMYDYAQSQGIDPLQVQSRIEKYRNSSSENRIMGGDTVRGMDDVQLSAQRYVSQDPYIRLAELREGNR